MKDLEENGNGKGLMKIDASSNRLALLMSGQLLPIILDRDLVFASTNFVFSS